MNDLMMINKNGPSLEDSDATQCVEHWYFHTKGFRHIKMAVLWVVTPCTLIEVY
jgi:hypothetical protein